MALILLFGKCKYSASQVMLWSNWIKSMDKNIKVYPNRKPWMTSEVQSLLRAQNAAFKTKDNALYSVARADLRRGIKGAKQAYKRKVEGHLTNNNPRQVWQGLKHITNYNSSPSVTISADASLAEELNHLFARFEATRPNTDMLTPLSTSQHTLTIQEHQVSRVFRSVHTRKATGPDGVPGEVIKACADQLAGVFTKIFNLSLTRATVPPCLKSATIIPVPKNSTINNLSDYRPIALTPVVAKCFERLMTHHIKECLPPTFDPFQFAYKANRSTDDAISTALHTALSHLEHPRTYVRMLFVDYSAAFNTIIPDILVSKPSA